MMGVDVDVKRATVDVEICEEDELRCQLLGIAIVDLTPLIEFGGLDLVAMLVPTV